jgi:ParB-like nuclease domain
MRRARAPSTAGPLRDSVLAVPPAGDSALSCAALTCPRLKNPKQKENTITDISSLPLNKLVASPDNVRKTAGADSALQELAASIAAHGLLQSLVVRRSKKGRFAVVAGGRRLSALRLLADAGKIEADYAVPCQVLGNGADAAEISRAPRTACASRCTRPTSSRPSALSSTAA